MGDISRLAVSYQLLHFREILFSLCVLAVDVVRGDVGYQHYLLVDIIERDYLVEQHEIHVLEVLLVLGIEVQGRLAVLYVVVGEIPHQSAGEGRESVDLRAAVLRHQPLDVVRRVALLRGFCRTGQDVLYSQFTVNAGDLQLRIVSQERVASPFLLVLDALENIYMAANGAQLLQYLNGGGEIRQDLPTYGDNAVAGVFLSLFKCGFQHDICSFRKQKLRP